MTTGEVNSQNTNNQNQNQQQTTQQGGTQAPATSAPPADWDSYIASLPADQKDLVGKLYTEKNQGLLNSVKATRDERDTLGKQLREAAGKLEKGSEIEKKLTETANQLDAANKRASFMEEAIEHDCKNPRAAFAVASANELFNKSGAPDWKEIEKMAPELFGKPAPKSKGGAGAGTSGAAAKVGGMSEWIRNQAKAGTNSE
jgi:hypothetical protein